MKAHLNSKLPNQPPTEKAAVHEFKAHGSASRKTGREKSSRAVRSSPKDVRSNSAWVPALRGDFGEEEQRLAHGQLSTYLYTASHNFLWKRQPSVHRLAQYGNEELAALAEDFVQQVCLKLIKDDYAILNSYKGDGRFLSWSAQILHNSIRSAMRKREWHESERLEGQTNSHTREPMTHDVGRPEQIFQSNQLADLVERVLNRLSEKNQTIFLRFVVDGERANVVAHELGISASGVYTAAHRIREKMGKVLIEAGYA